MNAFLVIILIIILVIIFLKLTIDPFTRKCKSKVKLNGKVVLVTGGNSGIGLETARDLAKRGAKVIIASTNLKKSEQAVQDIIETTGNNDVEYKYLNLASFKSIREFAEQFNRKYDRLDVLVNNAGCIGLQQTLTEDGLDLQMQINYFGPFLLTNLLLPKLIQSQPSRIVIVSSLAQYLVLNVDTDNLTGIKRGWFEGSLARYNRSKLFNVIWMKALAKRLPETITVNALHPGATKTDLFKRVPSIFKLILDFIISIYFVTPEQGAQTSIYLAVSEELNNKTGLYYAGNKPNWISFLVNDKLVEKVWNKSLEITKSEFIL